MTRQAFRTVDRVKLLIEADPVATTNLVKNPVPEVGTYLWAVSVGPGSLSSVDAEVPRFRFTLGGTTTNGPAVSPSGRIPVTPGQWLGVSALFTGRSSTSTTAEVYIRFDNAAGTQVGNPSGEPSTNGVSVGTWNGATGRFNATPLQAPATAVSARFTIRGRGDVGSWIEFTQVAARLGSTAASVAAVPYTEPYEWRDVLGKSHDIKAVHAGIGVGNLDATIYDATLDPAVSDALRGGRLVRLVAQNPAMPSRWESVWRGVLLTGKAEYDYRQRNVDRRARIQITAVNGVAQASNTKRPRGVGTIEELVVLLRGAGLPWAVNGSGTDSLELAATYVTTNPDASLLDQIAITRDTRRGYAWVDRRGVLNVSTAAARPATVAATLAEADYTELAVDYDTERCINEVGVKLLRNNLATGQTVEVAYGPFRDQASVDRWGAHTADFTVQGIEDTEAAAKAYADAVLAANATPVRKVNSLRFSIRSWADLTPAAGSRRALLDTYDLVRVVNTAGGLDQLLRPTTITHTLTAGSRTDKWLVDVEFGTDSGVAAPIDVPSPPGGSVVGGAPAPPAISGEYQADSGSVAAGLYSGVVTVNHGLGVTPSVVVGHLEDVSQGGQFGWFVAGRTSTQVAFRFLNQGPASPGQVRLVFRLIY